MNRLMGIDYGNTRIGIALTDPLQIIASGFVTLENTPYAVDEIVKICKSKMVNAVVIGIPFDQISGIGESARKVLDFASRLKKSIIENQLAVTFFEQDERYTTRDAQQSMREIKTAKKKKTGLVDQIAAANILKSFMDSRYKKELDIEGYLSQTAHGTI